MNEYSGYSIDTTLITLNTLTSLKVKVVSIMGTILRFHFKKSNLLLISANVYKE